MRSILIVLSLISVQALAALDYGSVQTSKEKQIEVLRNEEIRAVKTALSLRSATNRKAELYLRLAELYLEAYRADFLLEGRLHEKALEKDPKAAFIKERTNHDLQSGIGAAETILKLNVDSQKLDQVYYFLGYNFSEYGDQEKSAKYFKLLAKEYPNSPYAAEGFRTIGEEAFKNKQYAEAQNWFEQALTKTKDASQLARIHHKLGWCYYRQKKTNEAIESVKKAISLAQGDQEKFLSIREEGLRDLAIYYAESGRVDEAIDYFQKNAGQGQNGTDQLVKVLEKLGREYERTGQTENAKKVYQVLLQFRKTDDSSFRVAVKLIELDLNKQEFEGAYQRLRKLEIPESSDVETQLAASNLKRQVRSTAVNNHDRFRKMKETDREAYLPYLRVAGQYYSLYLNRFVKDDAEKNEIRMYLAEVKKELGDSSGAAQLYKLVIQEKDSKYSKDAAQFWVGSLAAELKKVSASGAKPGSEPTELVRDFVSAADLLEKSLPNSTEARESSLRAAQVLADYPSEKENVIERASRLAKNHSGSPQGVLAARLWLQLSPDAETLKELAGNSSLLDSDRKLKGDLSKDISALSLKLRVDEVRDLEKRENFEEAAQRYENFAKDAKTEKEAENAYIGAITNYAKARSSEEVFRVIKIWKSRYPASKSIEAAVKKEATLFLVRGLYADSAEMFLGIGRQFGDPSSYLTSAALFDGGLQPKKAVEVYKMALGISKNDEARAKIYRSLAYVDADMKDELGSFNAWKSCFALESSLKAECGTQVGNYHWNLKDLNSAKGFYDQVVSIRKGPSVGSVYRAYAQFRLAQILERDMKNAPLEFPEEKIIQGFKKRGEELAPVTAAYEKAIAMGGPWAVAATERLGDLSLSLANEVKRMLRSEEASDALKQTLEAVIKESQKRAYDRSKSAYQMALKEELLSPANIVIHDRLVDIRFNGMQRAQGSRAGIKLIGIQPDGGKEGADEAFKSVRAKLLQSQKDSSAWVDYGNLLWGTGKPGLAKIAYEYSQTLKTKNPNALNNLAVMLVSDYGYENWFAANEAVALWKQALKIDPNHSASLFNLGHFFNYYRLFSLSIPYLERAASKISFAELHDDLGVAYQATGRTSEAELRLRKAEAQGQSKRRFVRKFIEASKKESNGPECKSALGDIENSGDLKGFEKFSSERLSERCSS